MRAQPAKLEVRGLALGIFHMTVSISSLEFWRICRVKKQWILTDGGLSRKIFQNRTSMLWRYRIVLNCIIQNVMSTLTNFGNFSNIGKFNFESSLPRAWLSQPFYVQR